MAALTLGGDPKRAWRIGCRQARERTVIIRRGEVIRSHGSTPCDAELAQLLGELEERGLQNHFDMAVEGWCSELRELAMRRGNDDVV